MKILQAVYTSAVETLGGAQGYGFVLCSSRFPEQMKKHAKEDFAYSNDADGKPIYSLKHFEEHGSWVMLNRTVPAVDYTGRPIYVSHSLAFRSDELMDFLRKIPGRLASVFEFMRKFTWESSWSESETPRWIEEFDDLDASCVPAFRSDLGETRLPFSCLLAFDYREQGPAIEPKRAAWRFENHTPEEMLETFDRAWLCLDPWRGSGKYADHLEEPHITLLDSWRYSFTTNIRGGAPDAYCWAALSNDCRAIPNREEIIPSLWENFSPEGVKEILGTWIGHLLVDRCVQGPECWAQHRLRDQLKPHRERFEEEIRSAEEGLRKESENIIRCVKDETQKATVTWEKGVAPFWQDFGEEGEVSEWKNRFNALKEQTSHRIRENSAVYQQNAGALLALISPQDPAIDMICDVINLNGLQQDFDEQVAEYEKMRPYAQMSESLERSKASEAKLLSEKECHERELVSEKTKLQDQFTAERQEVAVQFSNLTAENEKIRGNNQYLEAKLEKYKKSLRTARAVAIFSLTLCLSQMIWTYFSVPRQNAESTQRKPENTPDFGRNPNPGKTESSGRADTADGNGDNNAP